MIVILDLGSQYSRLIARRVREQNVYCEILPHDASWDEIKALNPHGIILSGGPASVYEDGAPRCVDEVFTSKVPVLGICYGLQLMVAGLGGTVERSSHREYGPASMHIDSHDDLFAELPDKLDVWTSHSDRVEKLPNGFQSLARTTNSPFSAISNGKGLFGIQFHPEVAHTQLGDKILQNFVLLICGEEPTWTPGNIVADTIQAIRAQVGDQRVICALSGGVDSTVAAALLAKAVGEQLTCVFVDTGLLRLNEAEQLESSLKQVIPTRIIYVDASARFLDRLKGITEPEEKRVAIGHEFIRVFSDEAAALGDVKFLAQGTLYPDVIESMSHDSQASVKIKTHHNVGGLPRDLRFELIEPFRLLFKDEVRKIGREIGLPQSIIGRHPFPGPGLAVRIIGEVTSERLRVLRLADAIVEEEIRRAGWYDELWQSFAVLTPVQTVGVMGDGRTYTNVVGIRAVTSDDAMTADWARLPHELLAVIGGRLVNEIPEINRVVYDITSKPPATIEWE